MTPSFITDVDVISKRTSGLWRKRAYSLVLGRSNHTYSLPRVCALTIEWIWPRLGR